MRILVADSLESSAVAALEAAGHTCDLDPDLSGDTLPDHIGDHEALIVRSTKVTAATFDAGKDLRLVVRAGAGTNTIDVAAATEAGVVVTNVPGRNAAAVAELAFGLMLAIDRRIPEGVVKMRDGQWDKKGMSKGARGLAGAVAGNRRSRQHRPRRRASRKGVRDEGDRPASSRTVAGVAGQDHRPADRAARLAARPGRSRRHPLAAHPRRARAPQASSTRRPSTRCAREPC